MSIIPPNLNHSFICPVPVPFPDSGFPIPDSGFRFPDSGFSIRIRIPDSGFRFLDSGFRIPDFSIRPNSSTTSTLFQCLIFWLALRPTNRGRYLNYLLMINIYT